MGDVVYMYLCTKRGLKPIQSSPYYWSLVEIFAESGIDIHGQKSLQDVPESFESVRSSYRGQHFREDLAEPLHFARLDERKGSLFPLSD